MTDDSTFQPSAYLTPEQEAELDARNRRTTRLNWRYCVKCRDKVHLGPDRKTWVNLLGSDRCYGNQTPGGRHMPGILIVDPPEGAEDE